MSDLPSTSGLHVVHTINGLRADHGGPSRSAGALASATAGLGASVEIIAGRAPDDAIVEPDGIAVHLPSRPGTLDLVRPRTSEFGRTLAAHLGHHSVVHDHGMWLPSNHVAATVARQLSVPRVVSIRGMISDWALAQAALKKRVAWQLYQRRDLARASLLHATSDAEVEEAQRLRVGTPIARISNGVEIPAISALPPRPTSDMRSALFLSRIHPKKGLPLLIEAWSQVAPGGWKLAIAGPDEGGHRAEIEGMARKFGIESQIRFLGPIPDAEKWATYRSADLFVLPTHSENFGIVVAEALAAEVPVLTTRGAPWKDLERHTCGWWTDVGVEPIAAALAEATALPRDVLRAMGERGRALVEADYSWDGAARQMAEAYAWLLKRGPRPDFVTDAPA